MVRHQSDFQSHLENLASVHSVPSLGFSCFFMVMSRGVNFLLFVRAGFGLSLIRESRVADLVLCLQFHTRRISRTSPQVSVSFLLAALTLNTAAFLFLPSRPQQRHVAKDPERPSLWQLPACGALQCSTLSVWRSRHGSRFCGG